jgi:chromosome segregation ATPase
MIINDIIINQHVSSQSHYQSLIHSLEGKLTSSQSDLTSSMQLLQQTQQEFDSYKTRVHSVLKQKQTTPSVNEIEANLRQKFDIELITVKSELKDTQDRLAGVLSEYEELEGTHQELVRNHSDSLHSNQHESAKLKEKYVIWEWMDEY